MEVEWLFKFKTLTREELGQKATDLRLAKADSALAQAVRAMAEKSNELFKHEVSSEASRLLNGEGRLLRGRELVWMLAQYLKTNASMSMVFTIQDIMRFKWLGDNKLNEFYLGWMKLVNNVQANEEVSPTFL
eukprot:3360317-Alexandrium_andersonii.AAC.1